MFKGLFKDKERMSRYGTNICIITGDMAWREKTVRFLYDQKDDVIKSSGIVSDH
jgi:acyl-coenzyme A synthetase/AMP-(fatty) acid ligase